MDLFRMVIIRINRLVWSDVLVYFCLAAGIYYSFCTRFVPIRFFPKMCKLICSKNGSSAGISPFQSFVTTVGARVGMGNIAGVAVAVYYGGPGAVFWMWVIALTGASLAFAESALAQKYRRMEDGQYYGGPACYMESGLKKRYPAVLYALSVIVGPGMLMTGPQVQSVSDAFSYSFGISPVLTGLVCMVVVGIVIFGGIRRISRVAEFLTPLMCVAYLGMSFLVIGKNIEALPGALFTIVRSAFGLQPVFAGILGSTIVMGVKRGIYSNEAGQGNGAMIAAAAQCAHPVEQGLIQAASVYISTMLICTTSALVILCSGFYNVAGSGGELLVSNVPRLECGITWVQEALRQNLGGWAVILLTVIVVLFVFTSLMSYYYMAEANVKFLFPRKTSAVYGMRLVFILCVFFGALFSGDVVWNMGDIGAGLMVWINVSALLLMGDQVAEMLGAYE
ncbi:MAG: alanine:cation symporter family protein [Alistipes sp.]|nr:alanine:cation symporter family protein [Alistipes sp.]